MWNRHDVPGRLELHEIGYVIVVGAMVPAVPAGIAPYGVSTSRVVVMSVKLGSSWVMFTVMLNGILLVKVGQCSQTLVRAAELQTHDGYIALAYERPGSRSRSDACMPFTRRSIGHWT